MIADANAAGEVLHIRRLVPASPERVFAAWTDPRQLRKWWGPAGVQCKSAEIDLRIGGRYCIANEFSDGTILSIVGVFETIERPHLLVYTWSVTPNPAADERVTVRFDAHAQGTSLTITHERIASADLRDRHRLGWQGCLDGLARWLGDAA